MGFILSSLCRLLDLTVSAKLRGGFETQPPSTGKATNLPVRRVSCHPSVHGDPDASLNCLRRRAPHMTRPRLNAQPEFSRRTPFDSTADRRGRLVLAGPSCSYFLFKDRRQVIGVWVHTMVARPLFQLKTARPSPARPHGQIGRRPDDVDHPEISAGFQLDRLFEFLAYSPRPQLTYLNLALFFPVCAPRQGDQS